MNYELADIAFHSIITGIIRFVLGRLSRKS